MIHIAQTFVKPDLSGRLEQNNRTQAWEQLVTRQTQILGSVKIITIQVYVVFKFWFQHLTDIWSDLCNVENFIIVVILYKMLQLLPLSKCQQTLDLEV